MSHLDASWRSYGHLKFWDIICPKLGRGMSHWSFERFVTLIYLSQWPKKILYGWDWWFIPSLGHGTWHLWICLTHMACLWTNLDPKCTNCLCIWFCSLMFMDSTRREYSFFKVFQMVLWLKSYWFSILKWNANLGCMLFGS